MIRIDPLDLYRDYFLFFARLAFGLVNPGVPFHTTTSFLAVAQALDDVANGFTKRLLICLPPRSGKSFLASVALPTFLLGLDPKSRIITASYGADLAAKHARDSRLLMRHPTYRRLFPGTVIGAPDREMEVQTTWGGGRLATSVGGVVTGRGGGWLLLDDLLKPEEAESREARKRTTDWIGSTLLSRLDDQREGVIVAVMQRVHVDDPIAHLLEIGGFEQLILPAIAQRPMMVPIGLHRGRRLSPGEILDPERYDHATLERLRHEMGERAFSAQYLQDPLPVEGALVRWSWFRSWDRRPWETEKGHWLISWDTALKTGEINDWSVGIVAWVTRDAVYVVDVIRLRATLPDLVRRMRETAGRYRRSTTIIEDVGGGTSALQLLQRGDPINVFPFRPRGDKVMRLTAVTPAIERGEVLLPRSADWLPVFKRELLSFPTGDHDDCVDALSQLLSFNAMYPHGFSPVRPMIA